jgi:hypothetical protein
MHAAKKLSKTESYHVGYLRQRFDHCELENGSSYQQESYADAEWPKYLTTTCRCSDASRARARQAEHTDNINQIEHVDVHVI